jgi:Protein of unknown function (DUF1501)
MSDSLPLSRREWLTRAGVGFGALAMADLLALGQDAAVRNPLEPRRPHFAPKARRVLQLFANGGPGQMDTFDPKPALAKYAGREMSIEQPRPGNFGAVFPSPFAFRKYGRSGIEVSEIFPHLAECVDDLCVIRSMKTDNPLHDSCIFLMNCGEARQTRPSMGSWLTYGLGSENQNLPGFVALCPGGYPDCGFRSWASDFLPGAYQGTFLNTQYTRPEQLVQYLRNEVLGPADQHHQLDLLQTLNREHQERRREEAPLEARIQSFELASRMQLEATEAFDLDREPESTRKLYGPGKQAQQLILARRLLERGVRFVQVWTGLGIPWDDHQDLDTHHRKLAGDCDQAIAGLLRDLKQRGLLEDTLVVWGGEFGRTPMAQMLGGKVNGRDHNHFGFSMWMAGGGVKGGMVHGATDELGLKAVEKPVHIHDLHATILHLLGLDHEKLTYRHAGRDFRLTDVHGKVVHEILA